jgi:oligoendopeptidase F
MVQIIKVAAHEARSPEDPSDLDKEIEKLVKNRTRTIQETYEETVEMVVEADKLGKQCNQLLAKLDRLIQKATSREERAELLKAAKDLHSKLSSRIATLSKTPRH